MASVLHALPLGMGEAFLLITEEFGEQQVILVDSGNKKGSIAQHSLAQAICEVAPDIKQIDIAVCTHQDRDHVNGFLNFFDAWDLQGKTVKELWLPGAWADAALDAVRSPHELMRRIFEGATSAIDQLGSDAFDIVKIEEFFQKSYAEQIPAQDPDESDHEWHQPEGSLQSFFGITNIEHVELISQLDIFIDEYGLGNKIFRRSKKYFSAVCSFLGDWHHLESDWPLWQDAVETADVIRQIASSAIRHGTNIRWFSFRDFEKNSTSRGGKVGLLEPLNAVELVRPHGLSDMNLFFSLALSKQNVESLLFLRPETEEPAVLFSGDSRFHFGVQIPTGAFNIKQKKYSQVPIVTAPHHGSRVNDVAYPEIKRIFGEEIIYIRNGCHWKMKLNHLLTVNQKWCAQCKECFAGERFKNRKTRRITFVTDNGMWKPPTDPILRCAVP